MRAKEITYNRAAGQRSPLKWTPKPQDLDAATTGTGQSQHRRCTRTPSEDAPPEIMTFVARTKRLARSDAGKYQASLMSSSLWLAEEGRHLAIACDAAAKLD